MNTENSCYPCDDFNLNNAISAVYLGANIRKNAEYESIEREIEEWGKRNDIPIYEMRLHRSKYKIIKRH